MFLNEEEKSKLSKNKKSLNHKKRKKISKTNNYLLKYSNIPNDVNEERISLTEHFNILNEYGEELKFLSMKRKNFIPNDNIYHFKENPNNNPSIIICVNDKKPNKKRGKSDSKKVSEKKINKNLNNKNEDSIKMSQLFNLYHYLFIKSGLDCKKPSRFVDYLSNEIKKKYFKFR